MAQAEGLRVESKNGYRNRAGELKEFAMRWEMPGGTAARRGEVVESSKRKEGGSQSVYAQLRPVVAGQAGGLQNMTQGACVCVLFTNVKQKKKRKKEEKKQSHSCTQWQRRARRFITRHAISAGAP